MPRKFESIEEAIAAQAAQKCCLCGGEPSRGGIFIPKPEFAPMVGQPEGKTRHIFYSLCEPCFELPDREARIEASIVAAFSSKERPC